MTTWPEASGAKGFGKPERLLRQYKFFECMECRRVNILRKSKRSAPTGKPELRDRYPLPQVFVKVRHGKKARQGKERKGKRQAKGFRQRLPLRPHREA
ncbi:hypothetical protein L7F22_032333 [Adiantum nelumboides]|nr:hypothetical protein [Adiantum nelumboides]